MEFNAKLKTAMQQLGINQAKVVSLTGKSKGSVSQYISGKQIPSVDVQKEIATALGLDPEYFNTKTEQISVMPRGAIASGDIPTLDVVTVAKVMHMNHNTVRKGLQQGVFPWGYGIKTSDNRWVYFINANRFQEIEGVVI